MPTLTIKLDVDTTGGFDALLNLDDAEGLIHLTDDAKLEVGTLRHGMTSGKDSVAFCFTLPDGRVVVAETSAELYIATANAISAWQEGRRERGES